MSREAFEKFITSPPFEKDITRFPDDMAQAGFTGEIVPLYAIPATHRIVPVDRLVVDAEIIKALTDALSELAAECADGKAPKAPSMRALRRAAASLPSGYAGRAIIDKVPT